MLDWFTSKGRLWRFESLCALKFHYIKLSCLRLFSFLHTHTHGLFSATYYMAKVLPYLYFSPLTVVGKGCHRELEEAEVMNFYETVWGYASDPRSKRWNYTHIPTIYFTFLCISLFICYAILLDYLLKFLKNNSQLLRESIKINKARY